MNPQPGLQRLLNLSRASYGEVRRSRFVADKLSVGLVTGALTLSILNFVILVGRVHPASQGAIRYSSLDVGYTLGVWYYPYLVAAFGLGVLLVNTVLAYRSYGRSRLASFYLLVGSGVVVMFGTIISIALGAAR